MPEARGQRFEIHRRHSLRSLANHAPDPPKPALNGPCAHSVDVFVNAIAGSPPALAVLALEQEQSTPSSIIYNRYETLANSKEKRRPRTYYSSLVDRRRVQSEIGRSRSRQTERNWRK